VATQNRATAKKLYDAVEKSCQNVFADSDGISLDAAGVATELQPVSKLPMVGSQDDLIAGPRAGDVLGQVGRAESLLGTAAARVKNAVEVETALLRRIEADREQIQTRLAQALYDVLNLRIVALDRADEMANAVTDGPVMIQFTESVETAKKAISNFLTPEKVNPKGKEKLPLTEYLIVSAAAQSYAVDQKIPALLQFAFDPKTISVETPLTTIQAAAKILGEVEDLNKFQKAWAAGDPQAIASFFSATNTLLPAVPLVGPIVEKVLGVYSSQLSDCIAQAKTLQERVLDKETAILTDDSRASPEHRFYTPADVATLMRQVASIENVPAYYVDRVTTAFQIRRLLYLAGQASISGN
jgi:hypothetical protein